MSLLFSFVCETYEKGGESSLRNTFSTDTMEVVKAFHAASADSAVANAKYNWITEPSLVQERAAGM